MSKSVTITVHRSTNPQVAGRYFVELRDTTNGANRQMTTATVDDPKPFVSGVRHLAARNGIEEVNVIDTTNELPNL